VFDGLIRVRVNSCSGESQGSSGLFGSVCCLRLMDSVRSHLVLV